MQVCKVLGADGLIYQEVADLIETGKKMNPLIERFDASCFDGHYITGDISAADFDAIASQRLSQNQEEESPGRSRLALQSAEQP